ncbi:PQQ-binding-like beta-propeller repeat protein [Xylanimonas protaetiae]|uniref:outer membrane protein assembly factor BamB family protein n=1 Tax=Xylanimonas protaetiae TaxID=2509457 RepID=UPI0013E9A861|nr:PQQ-binding-like beta-propeller repeat protein [Xylanimonas protaetiae]
MGAVVGLVLAGSGIAAAVDVVRGHELRDRLVTAPGGVVGLAAAPAERWRTALDHPRALAIMDGLLVVAETVPNQAFGQVVLDALDPDDGAVRWSTRIGDAHDCGAAPGPVGGWAPGVGTADTVVCLTGPGADGVVVVVGAGGAIVADRQLAGSAPGEYDLAAPGAVVRVSRVGPPAVAPLAADGALTEDFTTRDMLVRLEDAVTGAERWSTTVPGATAPAGTRVDRMTPCVTWSGSGTPEVTSDENGLSSDVGAQHATLEACGVSVTLDLATGAVMRSVDHFDPDQAWDPDVRPLDGGGWATGVPAAAVAGWTTRVQRDDGTVVGVVDGAVRAPLATDGSPADVLLTDTHGLTGVDPADTSELWNQPGAHPQPLVRADGVVVVAFETSVVAVDARTGRELWRKDAFLADVRGELLATAFTDGRRAVIAEQVGDLPADGAPGTLRLRALDLATGDVTWSEEKTAPVPQAVGGRLYELSDDAVTALG